jgi:hypothetical protein
MADLNVLKKDWKIGDTRELTEHQIRAVMDEGMYDSYDQTYLLDKFKWKIAHRVANIDGSTLYTLTAVAAA